MCPPFCAKKINLLFAVQDITLKTNVLHAFAFKSFGDRFQYVKVIPVYCSTFLVKISRYKTPA